MYSFYITGSFVRYDLCEEKKFMKIEGEIVTTLTKIDPKLYGKFTKIENGKFVLCVKLKKDLYGNL